VALIVLVRPLSVALSIWPRQLDLRGRTVIALTAPRGIVAAAVASLAAREMGKAGLAGAAELEGLVYLTILATGAWATLVALVLPKVLGYTDDPARRKAVLVGANALSETLARLLSSSGRSTVGIDASSWRLERFRTAGLPIVVGDARDAATYEEAGVERDSLVISATTNDELNLLVAEMVRSEFGVEHPVVAIQQLPEELGRRSRAWVDLLGGTSVDVPKWNRKIENGQAVELTIDPGSAESVAALQTVERDHRNGALRLVGFKDDEPVFHVDDAHLEQLDRLTLLVSEGRPLEVLGTHRIPNDDETQVVEEVAANTPQREPPAESSPAGTSDEGAAGNPTKPV
jgi:hypothetical protein